MNTFKKILFGLLLTPACLLGMKTEQEKNWIQDAIASKQYGAWVTENNKKNKVIIEGELVTKNSKIFTSQDDIKVLGNMYADIMLIPNTEIINTYTTVWLFFNIKSLCTWSTNRERLYNTYTEKIKELMAEKSDDLFYIFTARKPELENGKKVFLGSVVFDIKKHYTYGTVELDCFVIKPEAQGLGLSKIFASAIFKLLPQTERIILDVLCTNKKAMIAYEAAGFTKYENKHEDLDMFSRLLKSYEFFYEYLSNKNSKLQNVAKTFKDLE
jgi:ribosomal protein S18 acetylase RimI-like enzyme